MDEFSKRANLYKTKVRELLDNNGYKDVDIDYPGAIYYSDKPTPLIDSNIFNKLPKELQVQLGELWQNIH
jgi:hypothetical protein